MKLGFVKVALATPYLRLGAPSQNCDNILKAINTATKAGAEIVALPYLCISGGPCDSMSAYSTLLDGCIDTLNRIAAHSTKHKALVIVSLPMRLGLHICNVVAYVYGGEVVSLQAFDPQDRNYDSITIGSQTIDIKTGCLILDCPNLSAKLAVVLGEDFDRPLSDATVASHHGANLIINLAASIAHLGSYDKRKSNIVRVSKVLPCAYAYVSGGSGMSVSGGVYSGDKIAAEYGKIIASSKNDDDTVIYADFDMEAVDNLRLNPFDWEHNNSYIYARPDKVTCSVPSSGGKLTRAVTRLPYVPEDPSEFDNVIDILARGIFGRMEHIGVSKVIFGLSGGLDSTMVLRTCVHMCNRYNLPLTNIICVTMSGFGTSSRTKNNAKTLITSYGVTGIDIPISDAVTRHLADIGHTATNDIVYENAQARERAQILLDLANKHGALMLGTGTVSEEALGWSTYGGDQLAQYNPNSSLSKTFVRAALRYYALTTTTNSNIAAVITDILATPMSPELIKNQSTEEILGPYEILDFYLYNLIGKGLSVTKTLHLAALAYPEHKAEDLRRHMRQFVTRFFTHQFKRLFGCDGIQITPFDLSGLRIKTDFSNEQWLKELNDLETKAK